MERSCRWQFRLPDLQCNGAIFSGAMNPPGGGLQWRSLSYDTMFGVS